MTMRPHLEPDTHRPVQPGGDLTASPSAVGSPGRGRVPSWLLWPAGLLVSPVLRAAVTAYAVPRGALAPRDCPACAAPLRYPWLSTAFLPRGRCPACGARIGPAPFAVEAVLAAVVVLLVWRTPAAELPAYLWWAGLGLVMSFVDIAVRRLPNLFVVACAGGLLLGLAPSAVVEHRGGDWLRAALAGAVVLVVFAVAAVAGLMGWGDAKTGFAVGAALGWVSWVGVYAGVFLGFLLAAVFGIARLILGRARRWDAITFGPFLFAGALLALLLLRCAV
jgi:leader peptidase (prepilin peptidase)/N-methyltransferase